jgi:hypothetical protein
VAAVPLLALFGPAAAQPAAAAEPGGTGLPPAAVRAGKTIVPNVLFRGVASAIATLQAAGLVVQTTAGWVDCGPSYVQEQTPPGGSAALVGSTVVIAVNQQPAPGQECP